MKLMCRIEPIINIQTGMRIGGEMLCQPQDADPEDFFRSVSSEILSCVVQKQIWLGVTKQNDRKGILFFNITIPLLMNVMWLKSILTMLPPGPKVIEIDCQQSESNFSRLVPHIDEILTLIHNFNTQLWLDDLYIRHIPLIAKLPFRFDGIKIDKHEFWRIYAEQDTQIMINLIKKVEYLADHVLVEGIENEYQYRFILESNVHYAQGFLWPVDVQESFVITI